MDTKRTMLVAVLLAGSLLLMSLRPRPALAGSSDFTTPLIIAGAVAGAATLITIIAIMGASSSDEPRYLVPGAPLPQRSPDRQRVHVGVRCPMTAGNLPLLCW
jgi:hypothetical protein